MDGIELTHRIVYCQQIDGMSLVDGHLQEVNPAKAKANGGGNSWKSRLIRTSKVLKQQTKHTHTRTQKEHHHENVDDAQLHEQ